MEASVDGICSGDFVERVRLNLSRLSSEMKSQYDFIICGQVRRGLSWHDGWRRTRRRDELRATGVETTDIVDHGWARSIYFKDPNGLSLEYCCVVGNRPENAAMSEGEFTVRRAALELNNTFSASRLPTAQSAHGRRKA
jgi:hypothetical protein